MYRNFAAIFEGLAMLEQRVLDVDVEAKIILPMFALFHRCLNLITII